MTKAEKIIAKHISKKYGLTSPGIAHLDTGYAFSTCKKVFKKMTYEEEGQYFLTQAAENALEAAN